MKSNFLLTFILLLMSLEVRAEWTKIVKEGPVTIYFDPKATRWEGNVAKIWVLWDHDAPKNATNNSGKVLSVRQQRYIRCKDETYAIRTSTEHSDRQAGGDLLVTVTVSDLTWEPAPPNTLMYQIVEHFCKNPR